MNSWRNKFLKYLCKKIKTWIITIIRCYKHCFLITGLIFLAICISCGRLLRTLDQMLFYVIILVLISFESCRCPRSKSYSIYPRPLAIYSPRFRLSCSKRGQSYNFEWSNSSFCFREVRKLLWLRSIGNHNFITMLCPWIVNRGIIRYFKNVFICYVVIYSIYKED